MRRWTSSGPSKRPNKCAISMDYYEKAKRSNQRRLGEKPESSKPVEGNEYVRRWLSQTQRKPDWESQVPKQHGRERCKDLSSWRPHNLEAVDLRDLERPAGAQKRRGRSPDSSIISAKPKRRRETASKHVSGMHDEHVEESRRLHRQGRRQAEVPSRSPLKSIEEARASNFEKRLRHKTRPDRYDTNKEERSRRKKEPDASADKAKRTKEAPNKNKKISSGRDIMKSYTAEAILTKDRLTVCHGSPRDALSWSSVNGSHQMPNYMTPGIFANARSGEANNSE
jgi:hypothetical protein